MAWEYRGSLRNSCSYGQFTSGRSQSSPSCICLLLQLLTSSLYCQQCSDLSVISGIQKGSTVREVLPREEKDVKLPHKASLPQEDESIHLTHYVIDQVSFASKCTLGTLLWHWHCHRCSQSLRHSPHTLIAYSRLWVLLWIEANIYTTFLFNLILSMSNALLFLLHVQGLHVLLPFL